jgi:hypothetical protein
LLTESDERLERAVDIERASRSLRKVGESEPVLERVLERQERAVRDESAEQREQAYHCESTEVRERAEPPESAAKRGASRCPERVLDMRSEAVEP